MGCLFRPSLKLVFAAICASLFLAGPAPGALAFEKPLPTDRQLTLEECIAYALGTHPRIKGAEQDVLAGQYRTKEAISAFWPQVAFQADAAYQQSSGARVGNTVVSNTSVIKTAG